LVLAIPNGGEADSSGTFHDKISSNFLASPVERKGSDTKKSRIQIKTATKSFKDISADIFKAADHLDEIRHRLAAKDGVALRLVRLGELLQPVKPPVREMQSILKDRQETKIGIGKTGRDLSPWSWSQWLPACHCGATGWEKALDFADFENFKL
jgi:hypothetical protein